MPARRPAARALLPWLILGLCIALMAGCGFHLKGSTPLPFDTLYTNIDGNSRFGSALRRAVVAGSPQTRFVNSPDEAQARLIQLEHQQRLREVAIDAAGHVEDYELNLEFVFQVTDDQGRILLGPTRLRVLRELPYDPDAAQAKDDEISHVFEDMLQSLVGRIIHRLTAPELRQAWEQSRQNTGKAAGG
ncbi:MAG: LPS assembly lipoprotein LptE [Castellaniella sp.]